MPQSSRQDSTPAETQSNTSVSRRISLLKSKQARTGAVVKAFFSSQKEFQYSQVYLKVRSFFVSFVRAPTILKQPSIKRRQKFTNPKNARMSQTFARIPYSWITFTFLRSIDTPFLLIIRPRYFIDSLQNLYFSGFRCTPASQSVSRIFLTCSQCSPSEGLQMRISSRYAVQNQSRIRRRMSLMKYQKLAGALVSLKGITRVLNRPYQVRKAVFYSSPAATWIRLQAS